MNALEQQQNIINFLSDFNDSISSNQEEMEFNENDNEIENDSDDENLEDSTENYKNVNQISDDKNLIEDENDNDEMFNFVNTDFVNNLFSNKLYNTNINTNNINVSINNINYNNNSNFKNSLISLESNGNYKAVPKDKNGNIVSSAVGKYQFLWDTHNPWIKKVTGVASKEEFLNSPQAQEKAFDYWEKNTLDPLAKKYYPVLKQDIPNLTFDDTKKIFHFAGESNVKKAINSKNYSKPLDAFKTSILSYIRK